MLGRARRSLRCVAVGVLWQRLAVTTAATSTLPSGPACLARSLQLQWTRRVNNRPWVTRELELELHSWLRVRWGEVRGMAGELAF